MILRGYRIVYRIGGEAMEILTVFESHRLLRSALGSPGPGTQEGEE